MSHFFRVATYPNRKHHVQLLIIEYQSNYWSLLATTHYLKLLAPTINHTFLTTNWCVRGLARDCYGWAASEHLSIFRNQNKTIIPFFTHMHLRLFSKRKLWHRMKKQLFNSSGVSEKKAIRSHLKDFLRHSLGSETLHRLFIIKNLGVVLTWAILW